MRGAITPLPQYAFMAWCLVKHRDNFTFYFTESHTTFSGSENLVFNRYQTQTQLRWTLKEVSNDVSVRTR
jgi:hypothetical protein